MNADSYNPSLNDLKCIWMTSGLVAYKLCNFEFDCENCEFDKAFRKNSNASAVRNTAADQGTNPSVDVSINRIKDERFDEKLIYLNNQLVVKKLFGNIYYLGVNPVIVHLFDNLNSINVTKATDIKKGETILFFEGDWGKKEIISPINFQLIERFIPLSAGFKLNKWFGIVIANETIDSQYNFDRWNEEKNKCLDGLKEVFAQKPEVGKTSADGGEMIKGIDQYLGKEAYLRLINGIFS
jgi:hypothetical protein